MDHAPLRPVPARPSGPISDADAVRTVSAALPEIGAREGLALALVALGRRERSEVAGRVGLDDAGLSEALAAARKALRRTVAPLPGSGWCERAEGLVSDRLDGALAERDVVRLDVHLRNCPRCVEHERRLVQATDNLVASAASVSAVAGPPELAEAPPSSPASSEEEPPGPRAPKAEEPPGPSTPKAEEPPGPSTEEEPAPGGGPGPVRAAAGDRASEAAPALAPPPHPRRRAAVSLSWHVLFALAVLLAVGALALAVAGFLGAGL